MMYCILCWCNYFCGCPLKERVVAKGVGVKASQKIGVLHSTLEPTTPVSQKPCFLGLSVFTFRNLLSENIFKCAPPNIIYSIAVGLYAASTLARPFGNKITRIKMLVVFFFSFGGHEEGGGGGEGKDNLCFVFFLVLPALPLNYSYLIILYMLLTAGIVFR